MTYTIIDVLYQLYHILVDMRDFVTMLLLCWTGVPASQAYDLKKYRVVQRQPSFNCTHKRCRSSNYSNPIRYIPLDTPVVPNRCVWKALDEVCCLEHLAMKIKYEGISKKSETLIVSCCLHASIHLCQRAAVHMNGGVILMYLVEWSRDNGAIVKLLWFPWFFWDPNSSVSLVIWLRAMLYEPPYVWSNVNYVIP